MGEPDSLLQEALALYEVGVWGAMELKTGIRLIYPYKPNG